MAKTPRPDEGYGKLLGITIERGEARARSSIQVRPELLNPHGVLHGGVMYSLADQAMGAAVYSLLEEAESCATIEIKIVYIAPVAEGQVECEARVVNKGRRVAVLEADVQNGGRMVAKALGTFAIFGQR